MMVQSVILFFLSAVTR